MIHIIFVQVYYKVCRPVLVADFNYYFTGYRITGKQWLEYMEI